MVLSGCAREPTVSENLTDNAITATNGLEQSLPTECKTESILTQIAVVKSEIRSISKACQIEKETITQEKLKWKISFWVLVGLVVAYVFRKLTK